MNSTVFLTALGGLLANARRLNLDDLGFWFVEPLPRGDHHRHTLAFHSELAFRVRSFFFVMLGVVIEMKGLRGYFALVAGVIGVMVVSRALSVVASGWASGGTTWQERRLALWTFPRGLITAVLAIQVLQARGPQFSFLPALAFATILITNLLMVVGSLQVRDSPSVASVGKPEAPPVRATAQE